MNTAVVGFCVRVVGRVPLPVIRLFAVGLGRLAALLPGRRQRRSRANLKRAFPELDQSSRGALAKANLVEMSTAVLEAPAVWTRRPEWLANKVVAVRGREAFERAHAAGRGVLFVSGHFGGWEVPIVYLGQWLPITFLYKPPSSKKLDALLTAYRGRFGAHMVASGSAAMREVLTTLRAGNAAGLLFDQLPRGGGAIQAPFFGRSVATMTLVHRLARRTGCAVVAGHCLRLKRGRGWTIELHRLDGFGALEDPCEAATRINAALEQSIRRAPEQYLWHYRRFDAD